ncbi:Uncharacterized protein TCM_028421 [Theobroma cacao]|uniref:Uncharacterized protein n=1 Tax=Theobroma cacao TaxID=3641 RepID=A0A061GHQ4_THECC|nr:Uncharacterized protein TCM_028421 [Theobroma cacao]
MISPMSANIVETAMAMGIRWRGPLGCYYVEAGPQVDYYDYLLDSDISLGFQTWLLSHGEKYKFFRSSFIYTMILCLIPRG